MLTCPCGRAIKAEVLDGVVFYWHEETQEDCPVYGSIGTTLESIFLAEYPTAAVRERRAMFLASQAVRFAVYRTLARADVEKMQRMLCTLNEMIEKSMFRDRILQECVTVFGFEFKLNWQAALGQSILDVQALPEPLERLSIRPLKHVADMSELDDELRRYRR